MTIEELMKLTPIIESTKYALYQTVKVNDKLYLGYQLNKQTNEINQCKMAMFPSPHVIEVVHGQYIQKIISELPLS